jgi:hypothetical protein
LLRVVIELRQRNRPKWIRLTGINAVLLEGVAELHRRSPVPYTLEAQASGVRRRDPYRRCSAKSLMAGDISRSEEVNVTSSSAMPCSTTVCRAYPTA